MVDSSSPTVLLRPAGKSERRCIMRHALGYYRALIIAGRYAAPAGTPVRDPATFVPALKRLVAAHPMLSAAIQGELTESPALVRPATLDLRNHLEVAEPIALDGAASNDKHAELRAVRDRLCAYHDQQFPCTSTVPPWKVVVLPLGHAPQACWLVFNYSHSHGDGPSGLSVHRSLLSFLRNPAADFNADPVLRLDDAAVSIPPLKPPVELAASLPITWSYLLAPVLGAYLPTALASLLGLRASATVEQPEDMWRATPPNYVPDAFHSAAEVAVVDADTLAAVLARCREQSSGKGGAVRLTGVLHQLIIRALSAMLPADSPAAAFVGQTAIDLRRLTAPGLGEGDVGLGVSVAYHVFPRYDGKVEGSLKEPGDAFWDAARATTAELAARAGTLVDQPIGLLHYLRSFRPWLEGQLGKLRDSSYEVSNILAFAPAEEGGDGEWKVGTMVFSQPANATGSPVNFNVVSRKGGDMVVMLTWQRGVLGLENEDEWARRVCGLLERQFRELGCRV